MRSNLPDRDSKRGQGTLGVLVVALAVALVVAIALNTGGTPQPANDGFLQSQSEATGQQSSQQVTNRLEVTAATGTVVDTTGDGTGDAVGVVNITVTRRPGSGDVDLRETTVQWVGPQSSYELAHDAVGDPDDDGRPDTDVDGTFRVAAAADADGSAPVLNAGDDRFVLVFDVGSEDLAADSTVAFGRRALPPGANVEVTVTTQSGATTTRTLEVPQSLSGKRAVSL